MEGVILGMLALALGRQRWRRFLRPVRQRRLGRRRRARIAQDAFRAVRRPHRLERRLLEDVTLARRQRNVRQRGALADHVNRRALQRVRARTTGTVARRGTAHPCARSAAPARPDCLPIGELLVRQVHQIVDRVLDQLDHLLHVFLAERRAVVALLR